MVGVQQVEHDPSFHVRTTPPRPPGLVDTRGAIRREIVVAGGVELLHPVEQVRCVEVLEIPSSCQICVSLVEVRQKRVQHRVLVVELLDTHVRPAGDELVVVERLVDHSLAVGGVVQPQHVLVAVGVVARQTDDRFLTVLGEAVPVVDLDVEGVHPEVGVDVRRRQVVGCDLDRLVGVTVDPPGFDPEPGGDTVVDEKPVREEDVRLVRGRELVADLAHVPWRAGDDLRHRVPTDALEPVVVGVTVRVVARVEDHAVLRDEIAVCDVCRRHVEVRLHPDDTDVFTFVVCGPAEHVDDRVLVVPAPLDGVVDGRHHQLDCRLGSRLGHPHVAGVDHLADVGPRLSGDRDRLRLRPVVAGHREVVQRCLIHTLVGVASVKNPPLSPFVTGRQTPP